MKFKYLLENDLITISEIPLHIQELGDVFAKVSDMLENQNIYIVDHNGWKAYVIKDGRAQEYNPLIRINDMKKLLSRISKEFEKPLIKYIVD